MLCGYHPLLGVPLVDSVLEEIRVGLESNSFTQQQHRLTFVRYLAALFLCHMCDVHVVLDTLYLCIWFGQHQQPQQPQQQPAGDAQQQQQPTQVQSTVGGDNRLDPAYDSFRLRLIVALLDGVAVFFTTNSKPAQAAQRHLRRYLLYLMRYVKMKEFVAFDVDQQLNDVMHKLGHAALKQLSWPKLQAEIHNMESAQLSDASTATANNKPQTTSVSSDTAASALSATQRPIGETGSTASEAEETDVDEDDAVLESDVQPEDLQAAQAEAEAESETAAADGKARLEEENEDEEGEEEDGDEGEEEDEDEGEEEDGEEDGENVDDDDEEDDEDDEEEEDEPDDDVWNRRRRTALSSEDASFERDLERLMADSIEQRRSDPRTQAIAPVESLLMAHGLQQSRNRSAVAAAAHNSDEEEVVVFKLLTRDRAVRAGGGDRGVRSLYVPVDSDMAVSSLANSKEMEEERRNVKRLVLAGLEREEREVQERERTRRDAADKQQPDRRPRQQQQLQQQQQAADGDWGGDSDTDESGGRGRSGRERGQPGARQAWEERSDSQQQQKRYSGGASGGRGQRSAASASSSPSSASLPSASGAGGRVGAAALPTTRPVSVSTAQSNRTSAASARSKADKNRGPRLDVASFAFLNGD